MCSSDLCVNLFSGIMECGDCHSRMNRKLVSAGKNPQGKTRKYPYYICSANKNDRNLCSSHMISEKQLEKAVLSAINGHILAMGELKEAISALEGVPLLRDETKQFDMQLLKVNEEIVKLQNVNLSLYEDLEEGVIDKKEYFELKQNRVKCQQKNTKIKYDINFTSWSSLCFTNLAVATAKRRKKSIKHNRDLTFKTQAATTGSSVTVARRFCTNWLRVRLFIIIIIILLLLFQALSTHGYTCTIYKPLQN